MVAGDVHIDHHIGILQAHAGTVLLAVAVLEPVDDGILDAIGNEARVGELVAVGHGVDGESAPYGHQFAPVVLLDVVVELVGVVSREAVYRFEYAQRGAAAEIGLVKHLEVTLERNHAPARLHIERSKIAELLGKHIFQSLEGLCHHFKVIGHNR